MWLTSQTNGLFPSPEEDSIDTRNSPDRALPKQVPFSRLMSLGPFDRRTRRSRCVACATSHSKCSGSSPCTRCQKRRLECLFAASPPEAKGAVIRLGRGRIHTPKDFRSPAAIRPQNPIPDVTTGYLFYFDMFVRANSFTGREPSFISDVQRLTKSSADLVPHASRSLFDAMLALGAMQAHSLGAMAHHNNLGFALRSYQQSLFELRNAVSNSSPTRRDSIAWSTFFLGLFEASETRLLQDASGQKWLQHMVFGTAQALVASGPAACKSGTMRTFFIQARTFEACRSIIFNQPSFLADPEWISLTDYLATDLDEILKLVVLSSNLRGRTAEFTGKAFPVQATSDVHLSEGLELAIEGFSLREALDSWELTASFLPESTDERLLSIAYHSATSIYLSGNYDYDLAHWQGLGVAVPILSASRIEEHFEAIVATVNEALKGSSLSPLLFLFPLRVAGARAKQRQQREAVIKLLQSIRRNFIVADAMLEELRELWTRTIG